MTRVTDLYGGGEARDFGRANKAVRKYLEGYAESEIDLSPQIEIGSTPYAHGLLIPSCGEGDDVISCIATIPVADRGAVIIVLIVNGGCESPAWVHDANRQTLLRISERYPDRSPIGESAWLHRHPSGALVVIDRATDRRLPARQGVGLARKIGADLLLALIASGKIESPWIYCSDADVVFPEDYFEQTPAGSPEARRELSGASDDRPRTAARIYRFRHRGVGDRRTSDAALQYEVSLRYYVLGLRYARSPYAFHTIGSTLAIDAASYAQVRGFPRRLAAEDFYLLNKLAKVGAIEPLSGGALELSPRVSRRVPFGTGAAVGKLLKSSDEILEAYDPRIFQYLRAWHEVFRSVLADRLGAAELPRVLSKIAYREPGIDSERLLRSLRETDALDVATFALAAADGQTPTKIREKFDGFSTLKLVHSLRDGGLASLPLRQALGRADFIPNSLLAGESSYADLAEKLEELEIGSLD